MPWGCPALCVCPVCSSRRETELRKRIESLEALAAKLEAENESLKEQASGEGLHATGCACRYCAQPAATGEGTK